MVVPTHWIGAVNDWTGGYLGIYYLYLEHSCAINFDPSYHGLVFGGGAEAGNDPIQAMVGAAQPGYHEGQGRAGSHRGGGGRRIGVGG